jgi:tetratricopeptide (TPR) repeat protein
MMTNMRCIRGVSYETSTAKHACDEVDAHLHSNIRELTMALVIDPSFAPALLSRAGEYLSLAEGRYADHKPSLQLFELAIKDFTSAINANTKEPHIAYCDRAIALASIGRYKESANGYLECMKHATNGVEDSPFVYQQLAHVYMKLGRPADAANILTVAIANATGGGLDTVIILGGMGPFRSLYPQYDDVPDTILAEMIRRRFEPQFSQTWDAEFIGSTHKIISSILPELYVLRGDAYLKAGKVAESQADYRRVKSDAWDTDGEYSPRKIYFDSRGLRNFEAPEPWPPTPPQS